MTLEFILTDDVVHDENDNVDTSAKVFKIRDIERCGVMAGCYSGELNKIFIWVVDAKGKGFLKDAMNYVCKKFNCNNVEFTNIITDALIKKLKGFEPVIRKFKGNEILCLVGKWECCENDKNEEIR